jgi:predicted transglutaminase-like cysteine proteinase
MYFIFGKKEADEIIIKAHEERKKITNDKTIKAYIRMITKSDRPKLDEINRRVDEINKEIKEIQDYMEWIQEEYKTTIDRNGTLLKQIFEIVYPNFLSDIHLPRFG